LRVLTASFPAEYGGNCGIVEVTSKKDVQQMARAARRGRRKFLHDECAADFLCTDQTIFGEWEDFIRTLSDPPVLANYTNRKCPVLGFLRTDFSPSDRLPVSVSTIGPLLVPNDSCSSMPASQDIQNTETTGKILPARVFA